MPPREYHAPPGSLLSRWLSDDDDDDESSSSLPSTPSSPSRAIARVDSSMLTTTSRSASPVMVSAEEYASLPESIQRKYFLSVERLRIAQESAARSPKKLIASQSPEKSITSQSPCRSPRTSTDNHRPRTSHSVRKSTLKFSSSKEVLAARRCRSNVDVDEHQALRFLALPSRIKRAHFTREELILLTESSERVLGWAALHINSDCTKQDRDEMWVSSRYSSDSDDSLHDMEKDWFEAKTESLHTIEQADADDEVMSVHPRIHEGAQRPTVNFSRSRSTPLSIQRPATRYNKSNARRRVSLLAPIPFPPPTLLPVSLLPLPALSKPTESGTDTKYYKDTDARSKLREFLTSPDKVDEALEFGFPERRTTSLTSSVQPSLPSELDDLSITHTQDDEDDDDEDDYLDYLSGPRTPSVSTESCSPGIVYHKSLDSGVNLPFQFARGKGSIRSLSPDFDAGRSMTMKMTLTRSDLRAPEDKLYSMARMAASGVDIAEADPLALDPLPVCDDHTGAQGAFAVMARPTSGGGLKKVWKNLRGI